MKYAILPIAKPRMTQRDKWKKRPVVLAYHHFKDEARRMGIVVPEQCKIIFHLPIPSSWSKTKKAQHIGKPHLARPDLDNMLKALYDALLTEDSHVWRIEAEKRWAEMPSIEIVEAA